MTNQGDRLQVRLGLNYKGANTPRALEKWIPDALDRYFNADKPGQMYVDEIAVEPAEPVPPVPDARYDICTCGEQRQHPDHDLAVTLEKDWHAFAERPAEGTSDVEALSISGLIMSSALDADGDETRWAEAWKEGAAAIVSLIQRQRAEAVKEYEASLKSKRGDFTDAPPAVNPMLEKYDLNDPLQVLRAYRDGHFESESDAQRALSR